MSLRKNKEDLRSSFLSVRFNAAEREKLRRECERAGVSAGEYIRGAVFGKTAKANGQAA